MPYDVDEFNKFCWNLAARYSGRISYYEIWNEPQLADFLYPYDDSELNCLATMTSRAYSTIRSIDPNVMIISASMLPRASSGGMTKAQKYLSALKSHGRMRLYGLQIANNNNSCYYFYPYWLLRSGWNVDAFATHIYPDNGAKADVWLVHGSINILSFIMINSFHFVIGTLCLWTLKTQLHPMDLRPAKYGSLRHFITF